MLGLSFLLGAVVVVHHRRHLEQLLAVGDGGFHCGLDLLLVGSVHPRYLAVADSG